MGRVSKIGIDIKTGMRIGKYYAGVDQGGWAWAHQVPPPPNSANSLKEFGPLFDK